MAELADIFEIWTPNEIKSYCTTVASGYSALAKDITIDPLGGNDQKAWQLLLTNFLAFYQSVGFFSTLALGTLRTAEEYARQLVFWRAVYEKKTGKTPTGATVDIPSQAQAATLNTMAWLGGLGLAAYVSVAVLRLFRR